MKEEIQHTLFARLLHWVWVVAMLILILTGLYIHDKSWMPIFSNLGVVWPLHYITAIVLFVVVAVRIVYSAFPGTGDFKDLFMDPKKIKDAIPVVMYYTFLSKKEPKQGKYNYMQRMVYSSIWIPLLIIQLVTGVILYLSIGAVVVRVIHYLVMWILIATILLHLYLGAVHGWSLVKSMITGKLDKAH